MNEKNELKNEKRPAFGVFLIRAATVQAVVVAVLLISIYIIKSFFADCFEDIKKYYNENFTVTTQVSDVLEDGEDL